MICLSFPVLTSFARLAAASALLLPVGAAQGAPLDITPSSQRKAVQTAKPAGPPKTPKVQGNTRPKPPGKPVEMAQPDEERVLPPAPVSGERSPLVEPGREPQAPGPNPGPVATDLDSCAPAGADALYDRDGDVQRNFAQLAGKIFA